MNIFTTNAYCSRFLTDWAGPDAMVTRLAVRLAVPVFPGSVLRFRGVVSAVDGSRVEVTFRAANELGDHATGVAVIDVGA